VNDRTIGEIVEELRPLLAGRAWGKVFQLSRVALAVDFRTGDGRYLLLSAEPSAPRLHMIRRTVRELEKGALASSPFALVLRKALGGAVVTDIRKDEGDRVVRFAFRAHDEAGRTRTPTLVVQLTGRSSNIFLLDEEGRVVDSLRHARGTGQEVGEKYAPPAGRPDGDAPRESRDSSLRELRDSSAQVESLPNVGRFTSLSDALDEQFLRAERERAFDSRARAHAARVAKEIEKRRKLLRNLEQDLARHGDADEHRRAGDLLLANVATAERAGPRVRLTDYYAKGAPTVELEIDEGRTLQEEAAHRFARYTKARRAAEEVAGRIETVRRELSALEEERAEIERIVAERDADALEGFGKDRVRGAKRKADASQGAKSSKATAETIPGVRRYRSTDGYEVLVGRAARDNEHLTFRVARSTDLWLHAADYPGSHVVVRNQRRNQPVPHRTVVEAAQLAAHFSQARKDAKVAVNYTERKFVSKIKGAAPGLVRLSSFRTLMVEPREALERI
jgi:predicted ribosome quality control (RQC) complex YloA/Tae2 family protein